MNEQLIKKPITIQVQTKQRRTGEPLQIFKTKANGTLYCKDTLVYITYDESDKSGLGSSKTTLKIDPNQRHITVIRFGAVQMKYSWELGHVSESLYQTPFGTFPLTVKTDSIRMDLLEPYSSGNLNIEYRLDFGGEKSRMTYSMSFSEEIAQSSSSFAK